MPIGTRSVLGEELWCFGGSSGRAKLQPQETTDREYYKGFYAGGTIGCVV